MDKDIEWLKGKIEKMSYMPKGLDESNAVISKNWVNHYIDQMGEPKNPVETYFKCFEQAKEILEELGYTVIEKPATPIVPQFMVNWYEKNKLNYDIRTVMENIHTQSPEVFGWVCVNPEEFARMWLFDGYEVEKENCWVVKTGTGYLNYLEVNTGEAVSIEVSTKKEDAICFYEESRANLFAVLVRGSVEEMTR